MHDADKIVENKHGELLRYTCERLGLAQGEHGTHTHTHTHSP